MTTPATTNQMMNDVLQFCMDAPDKRDAVFSMAGHGSGAYQVVKLWLAVETLRGRDLAQRALASLVELETNGKEVSDGYYSSK